MKTLMISGTFPPRKFGGITAVSYTLAKKLAKRGNEVTVYTTDVGNDSCLRLNVQGTKDINGINVHYFKNINNSLAFKHRLYLPIGMVSAISKDITNFDIIHLHDYRSFLSVIIHHYAKKYGVPYVLQAHGSLATYFQKGMLKKFFDKLWGYRILKDASKVIALTNIEAEQYKDMGVRKDKIEIIPNGIDLSEFENLPVKKEFRKKWGIDDNEKIVLYLARIHKIKGPDLLIKAFADLLKKFSSIKLIIAGPDDGYLPTLQKLIKELKIGEKVLFTGPFYGRDKLEAFVDADIYVLPSVYETFPVSVLEALACGIPVIITDRCGIADILNGQAGLVTPYNPEQLKNAIIYLLTHEKARKKFREKGKKLVYERFTWPKITEQVEKLYLSLVK